MNSDGSFSYTHDGSETLTDSFTYQVDDNLGRADTAIVTLTVRPINDDPLASDDAFVVTEDGTLNVAAPGVTQNDTDPEGDSLTVRLLLGPSRGALVLNADGSFQYAHNGSATTTDQFTYEVDDNRGGTDTATVRLTIPSSNRDPVAADDEFVVTEGGTLNVAAPGVKQNDTDPEDDPLTVRLVQGPSQGELVLNSDGSFQYTHDGSETTSDQFSYAVDDGQGGSDTATVRLTILPNNDRPVAEPDRYSVNSGATLDIAAPGLLENDADAESNDLSAILVEDVKSGTLTLNADGSFSYQNNGGQQDSFRYLASDGSLASIAVTVTIDVIAVSVPGDFNDDGSVTAADIDLLCGAINTSPANLEFDLSSDGIVDLDDMDLLIFEILNTSYGDANLDGAFDSSDLVTAFQAGEYEDGVAGNSTWAEGDWNCDGEFTTTDLVLGFQTGDYENGASPAIKRVIASDIAAATAADALVSFNFNSNATEESSVPASPVPAPGANPEVDMQSRDLIFADDDASFVAQSPVAGVADELLETLDLNG